jgi:uncharacterized protein
MLSGGMLDPAAGLGGIAARVDASFGFQVEDFPMVLGQIGWVEFFQINAAGPLWRLSGFLQDSRALKVFAMFLVGFVAARRLSFRDMAGHHALLRSVLMAGAALGLTAGVAWAWASVQMAPAFLSWTSVAGTALYAVGVVPLALAYAAGFALLWQRPWWQRQLMRLAPAGRMALTNYLAQSVMGIALFYGVGLGWVGRVGPTLVLPMVGVIFVAQVQLSAVWLRRFRYGPVEWLWRSLTYGQRQPMRIAPAPAVMSRQLNRP